MINIYFSKQNEQKYIKVTVIVMLTNNIRHQRKTIIGLHTSLYGQQAHVESDSLQQVCVFEQRVDSSHNTSSKCASVCVCNRVRATLRTLEALTQVPNSRLQV